MKRLLLLVTIVACTGDTVQPRTSEGDIIARNPAPDAATVSVSTDITVVFGSAVSAPTDLSSVARLERGGQWVSAQVRADDALTLTITPADVLEAGARYTVRIGPGLMRHGKAMASYNWEFTTAGAPPPELDAARLMQHVRALADDSMMGRRAGSPEELKAAEYIRNEFIRYGLTSFPGNEWFQTVPGDGFSGTSQNVIAAIPGSGSLTQEWVVIGAHYDHIGVLNGQVFNGADDNASGTAAVLEIARALAQHAGRDGFGSSNRRSIMLVGFGAEERGLVGSARLCRWSPWVPMANVSAMLNLDMIGRLRDRRVYLEGLTSGSAWPLLLNRYEPSLIYFGASVNSDQRCYANAGRPVLAFHTGLHSEYHKPEDDAGLINGEGANSIATLAVRLAINLAVRRQPLAP